MFFSGFQCSIPVFNVLCWFSMSYSGFQCPVLDFNVLFRISMSCAGFKCPIPVFNVQCRCSMSCSGFQCSALVSNALFRCSMFCSGFQCSAPVLNVLLWFLLSLLYKCSLCVYRVVHVLFYFERIDYNSNYRFYFQLTPIMVCEPYIMFYLFYFTNNNISDVPNIHNVCSTLLANSF